MKVTILGCGKIGMSLREFLSGFGGQYHILCIDKKVPEPKNKNVAKKRLNLEFLTPDDVKGTKVIINTSPKMDIGKVMNIAKSVHASVVDLVSNRPVDERNVKKWAIFDAGMSPGISNILAARLHREVSDDSEMQILSFHSRYGQKYTFPFGFKEAVEYALKDPIVVKDGNVETQKSFRRFKLTVPDDKNSVGTFTFRDYFGPEVLDISNHLGEKNVVYKFGGADADYLDTIRTTYRFLKQTNSEEEARKKLDKFLESMKHMEEERGDGISGVYVKKGGRIYGVADPKFNRDEYEHLNYATYPMCAFVHALLLNSGDIEPGVYTPDQLPESLQNKIMDEVKHHFKNAVW